MNNKTFIKICYIASIILLVLGVVMTIFSLIIILPSITLSALTVPGSFIIIALIGLIGMIYYKKKL